MLRLTDGGELRARNNVIATGSDAPIGGGISNLADALAARRQLRGLPAGSPVLIRGAGLTGIELAAEVATRRPDLAVHLHDRGDIGGWLPERARAYLLETLDRLGVRLGEAAPSGAFELTTTGMRIPDLAARSGLETDQRHRVAVSATLDAEPGIWGAGDAVTIAGQPQVRGSCAAAIPMGAHVADNVARALHGRPAEPFDFGFSVQCISLGRRDGLIIQVDAADRPTGRFLRGRAAAAFKAAVCAGALQTPANFARLCKWRRHS
jgi:NADH dehydrogenase FAD-containing subunit